MGRRLVLCLVVAVGGALLVAPAALAISLSSIGPAYGARGNAVSCTVSGSFITNMFIAPRYPVFTLDSNSGTTISGSTSSYDADSASVTFTIPASAPIGFYDLEASQDYGSPLATATTTPLANAFYVAQPPTVTGTSPTSAVAGSGDLLLTVMGDYYVSALLPARAQSYVEFNGTQVPTDFVVATTLTAHVPASALTTAGTAAIVAVTPGSALLNIPTLRSAPYTFTITAPAVPAVTAITPSTAWAGDVTNDIVLTVTGTSFLSGARIQVGPVDSITTTFVSSTQLTMPLTTAFLATPTTLAVSVKNPPFPPGTPSAGSLPLTVVPETSNPVVTISGADSGWHNAPVALTFTASDPQSGLQKVQYMAPPAVTSWTNGSSYTVPTTDQGTTTVSAQALDWCNNVGTAGATVNIDTTPPGTQTQGDVSVKKGRTVKLKYRITEPAGLSPQAVVTIKVLKSNGKTAQTLKVGTVSANSDLSYSYTCNLKKGTYSWNVYATDLAGNAQANLASARIKVK